MLYVLGPRSVCVCHGMKGPSLLVMDELSAIKERSATAEVVVVGGGYAGVELAATLAEKLAGHGRVKVGLCTVACLHTGMLHTYMFRDSSIHTSCNITHIVPQL